jgi:glyoxylase-like metal-dependent hydrolase (beta-lactamase superfamily II)
MKTNMYTTLMAAVGAVLTVAATPPNVLAAAPSHHAQSPGYYRLKVGDLEITSLYDGGDVFDPHWLIGPKTELNNVATSLLLDNHRLDGADEAFLVNTGKQLILVDAGAGSWWGGPTFGHVIENLKSAGYTADQVDMVLVTHMHADHIGGLTSQDGQRLFPNATVVVAKKESEFWLSRDGAEKAPQELQPWFKMAQAIAAPYVKAGKWHTFSSSDTIAGGTITALSLPGHTPGHVGYQFSSQGENILFWGDLIHAQRVQLAQPEITVVFDMDPDAVVATRLRLLALLSSADIVIAGPHMAFPGLGRVHKDENGYSWAPVVFVGQWKDR